MGNMVHNIIVSLIPTLTHSAEEVSPPRYLDGYHDTSFNTQSGTGIDNMIRYLDIDIGAKADKVRIDHDTVDRVP